MYTQADEKKKKNNEQNNKNEWEITEKAKKWAATISIALFKIRKKKNRMQTNNMKYMDTIVRMGSMEFHVDVCVFLLFPYSNRVAIGQTTANSVRNKNNNNNKRRKMMKFVFDMAHKYLRYRWRDAWYVLIGNDISSIVHSRIVLVLPCISSQMPHLLFISRPRASISFSWLLEQLNVRDSNTLNSYISAIFRPRERQQQKQW